MRKLQHDDAAEHIGTHKVSLDPYRLQSRRILAVIKEFLPVDKQKVEKAGIDEVFLDLSAHVHAIMLERFPELARPPPYDDPSEQLPSPSMTALDWQADALVDLDDGEAETDDPDWDDIAFLIGSEIVRGLRAALFAKLKYTCSSGIANNKMLSKLGSGHKKPNQQTVVRNRAIQHFLTGFKFTKIRNLGGKLGDQVAQLFNTEQVTDLLAVPLDQLKAKLGDDNGIWVYNVIRGVDNSEVNARTAIKSMLSAKSFRPSINSFDQGVKWLRIFCADIFSRLVEEGVLENKRRPKTINLHHRHGGQTRSRQTAIPQGRALTEDLLFDLSKSLFSQIILEGNVWPCANLSLSVGGFEDGVTGNMGIGAFLVRGDEAQELKSGASTPNAAQENELQHTKRRRLENGGIQRFFANKSRETSQEQTADDTSAVAEGYDIGTGQESAALKEHDFDPHQEEDNAHELHKEKQDKLHDALITNYICRRCNASLQTPEAMQSHQDWHLAKDLDKQEQEQEQERVRLAFAGRASTDAQRPTHGHAGSSRKVQHNTATGAITRRGPGRPAGHKKDDPGQRKLNFG
jgi:DNA polymerase eta